jgi:hypothetical protein
VGIGNGLVARHVGRATTVSTSRNDVDAGLDIGIDAWMQ